MNETRENEMKKVLFATTALVATSGVAFAEIDVSGYIEAGIVGGDGGYAQGETQFLQHWGVTFSGTSTTDSGLTFGFTGQIDDLSNPNAGGSGAGNAIRLDSETAFISGSWGTLTLGDTDGAFDWAMQEVGFGTSIADDHTSHAGFSFNSGLDGTYDDQVLRYNHSVGNIGFAVSLELDDAALAGSNDIVGVGVTYDADLGGVDLGIGLGYQSGSELTSAGSAVAGDVDIMGVSLDLGFAGGFGARLNYSEHDSDVAGSDEEHMGIGVSYSSGPLLVEVNYGEVDYETGADDDGVGFGVNYDLGGGAVLMFGYGSSTAGSTAGNSNERWSLGLGMSF